MGLTGFTKAIQFVSFDYLVCQESRNHMNGMVL